MNLSSQLRDAARRYFDIGWVAMPLENDSNGFPKKPFVSGWQDLVHEWDSLDQLPWERAVGLGLVLGRASGNLAVLDIDDQEMANEIFGMTPNTRCVRTIRNRGHLYVNEVQSTQSTRSTVRWRGRDITIELKSQGTQVAAPPTPGYERATKVNVITVPSLPVIWTALSARLGVEIPVAPTRVTTWQPKVVKEQRNTTIYTEAHRLREAGMPLEIALGVLQSRWERDYEQGEQTWYEVERTIRSAYRKPTPQIPRETDAYNLWTGR
jgi:hypothetical protein